MERIEPFIRCSDYWPFKIPHNVLAEYRFMLEERQITKPNVVYNSESKATLVTYEANQPHEWIKERLKKVFLCEISPGSQVAVK